MKLYNVFPSSASFQWNGPPPAPPVYIKGVWVGSPGRENGFLNNFVPIVVHDDEPNEIAWGVQASRSNRPKIIANTNPEAGWIAVISPYNGVGKVLGQVLIAESDLKNVLVLTHGVGGNVDVGVKYWEYLVLINGPVEFLIEVTAPPRYLLRFTDKEVTQAVLTPNTWDSQNYILLNDPIVPHWRHNGKVTSDKREDQSEEDE